MKKIPNEIDNPIDNVLIHLSDLLCPLFKRTGHTPNMITTYSLIFGLVSVFCVYKGYVIGFALSYMLSYFFDCMDGHFARKYDMITEFGDYYDHVKDVSIWIMIIIVIYMKYKPFIKASHIIILLITMFAMSVHIGCQQEHYNDNNNNKDVNKDNNKDNNKDYKEYNKNITEMMDRLKCLCKDKNMIYYTRYVGMGTFIVVFIFIVCLIMSNSKK